MPQLTDAEKKLLSPSIAPFENSNKKPEDRRLKDGETEHAEFLHAIHDGINNKTPKDVVYITTDEIDEFLKVSGKHEEKSYLWVIDESSIKIIREKTRNVKRTHKSQCVCHTNLTGGKNAFLGGEMYFGEDDKIYINFFSDRYSGPNATSEKWEAAKQYFIKVGYTNLVDILQLIDTK